nr:MAG TPA: hypothetical protein [Caudoviricetes sp.]
MLIIRTVPKRSLSQYPVIQLILLMKNSATAFTMITRLCS